MPWFRQCERYRKDSINSMESCRWWIGGDRAGTETQAFVGKKHAGQRCAVWGPRDCSRSFQKHLAGVQVQRDALRPQIPMTVSSQVWLPPIQLSCPFAFLFNCCLIFYRIDSQSKPWFPRVAPLQWKYSRNYGVVSGCECILQTSAGQPPLPIINLNKTRVPH